MQTVLIVATCVNVVACCVAAHNIRSLRQTRRNIAAYAEMLRAGYAAQLDRPEA